MQFEKKISLGNVLTLVGMFVAVFFAYFELRAEDISIRGAIINKETAIMGKVESVQVGLMGKISNLESKVEYVETDTKRRLSKIESKIDQLLDYQMNRASPKK